MNEEEPIEFEPGLPVEEVDRRIQALHEQQRNAGDASRFYRSLGGRLPDDGDEPADAEAKPAISAWLDAAQAGRLESIRDRLTARLDRPATNEDLLQYLLRNAE